MSIVFTERPSDSPFVEKITHGYLLGAGSSVRPAECHWHMVITRHEGGTQCVIAGPLTASGVVSWPASAEVIWVQLKLGTFMPHLPARMLIDAETPMPDASRQSFWLNGSAWQFPNHENVDTFIDRLARQDILARDPLIGSVLQGQLPDLSPRTVRGRFLRVTGMTQGQIHQIIRAQRAADLLRQGVPILDTVDAAGYFDQPHLTRSLRQWVGHTPAQLLRAAQAG